MHKTMATTTPTIQRILIRTHHMTSRKKITAIRAAAKTYSCSVLLKTGRTPGLMIAEGEAGQTDQWIEVVKKLRYKDYTLKKKGVVQKALLEGLVRRGSVTEIEGMREVALFLGKADLGGEEEGELLAWWRRHMGFEDGET